MGPMIWPTSRQAEKDVSEASTRFAAWIKSRSFIGISAFRATRC